MAQFQFNMDDFHYSFVTGDDRILRASLEGAYEVIKAGGQVVIQQEYKNAEPDVKRVIRDIKEFLDWVKYLNKITGFNISL